MTKTVEIKSIASTGKGTGHVEEGGFKVPYFVEFTAPGDVVEVEETKRQKKYVEAEAVKFIKKANRSDVTCKHYMICGGCNLLHIDYDTQLQCKKEILSHILSRNNIESPDIEVVGSDPLYNYRYRAKVFFESINGKLVCGFNQRRSNDLVQIEECHIVHKKILAAIMALNNAKLDCGMRAIGVFTVNEADESVVLQLFSKQRRPMIEEALKETVKEITYEEEKQKTPMQYKLEAGENEYSFSYSTAFIQSNLCLNKKLVNSVFDYFADEYTGDNSSLVDLYCGNGNLGIPLAQIFKKITLVEGERTSFSHLKENISKNRVNNATTLNSDVARFVRNPRHYDAVVLDPPRTGCTDEVISGTISMTPNTIVYVSCDPAVSTKEIKTLLAAGYGISKIIMFDMFPHTNHIESVYFLNKQDG
jgi:23S rRNA (uracil1939-C5)-methyltransferase